MKRKVFGVGMPKTGTTSLGRALEILGYRVCGGLGKRVRAAVEGGDRRPVGEIATEMALVEAARHDAFQDEPWPVLYREMECRYPGSLFLLTLRPEEDWIRSFVRHFGTRSGPLREWVFGAGCPEGNEERYLEGYRRHNREVQEHFGERLLVLRLCEGEGWEALCPFLGVPIPDAPFPRVNTARGRARKRLDRVVEALRRERGQGTSSR